MDFMVHAGAEHSMVTRSVGPSHRDKPLLWKPEVAELVVHHPFVLFLCNLGSHEVIHKFLYFPDCPVALTGQDLLGKLQAHITFSSHSQTALTLGKPEAKILTLRSPREKSGTTRVSRMVPTFAFQ